MRFKTEQEGLEHIKGKEIRDTRNPKAKTKPTTDKKCKEQYDHWLERKKFMFSPEEQIALRGEDHRGHKGAKNQTIRNHHVNTFVDWAEERPRRRAVIVIEANHLVAATNTVKRVDIIGGDQTFAGLGLSKTGKEPATHLWCSWSCSASEYDFFQKQNMPWWRLFELFDGEDIDAVILKPNELKRILPKLEKSPKPLFILGKEDL